MSDLLYGPYCLLPDSHVWIAAENSDPALSSDDNELFDTAHVLRASNEPPESLLNPDDLRRWQKYRCASKKAQFLQSRRVVRAVLEHELGDDIEKFVFGSETSGRPFVRTTDGSAEKWISISHSDSFTAVAYSWGSHPVGIDLETIRPLKTESLTNVFVTDAEKTWLREKGWLDSEEAIRLLWTMKEAVWKSTAGTEATSLADFSVVFQQGELVPTLERPDGATHAFRTRLFGSGFLLDWPTAAIVRLPYGTLAFQGCLAIREAVSCKSPAD